MFFMATIAAPGFYAAPPLPISTTVDAMGHQSTDFLYSPAISRFIFSRGDLVYPNPGQTPLAGSFGARRARRFASGGVV